VLNTAVCTGALTLAQAQLIIRSDWVGAWKQIHPNAPTGASRAVPK
jgi:hypothetical protein